MRLMHHMAGASLLAQAVRAADDGSAPAPPQTDAAPPAEAPKKVKTAHVVWAAPGSDEFRIGGLYLAPADVAEGLRAAGRARPASDEEVKAAKKAGTEIPAILGA